MTKVERRRVHELEWENIIVARQWALNQISFVLCSLYQWN